jgi:hypothetical protein
MEKLDRAAKQNFGSIMSSKLAAERASGAGGGRPWYSKSLKMGKDQQLGRAAEMVGPHQ